MVFVRRGMAPAVLVKKASQRIEIFETLELALNNEPSFVSRGGIKLHQALIHVKAEVSGLRCIDFGQSTGGFTDCLLQAGALSGIGLDVGKDQLHKSLRSNPNVLALEGINLKNADMPALEAQLRELKPDFLPVDFAVADLSFISLGKVLPNFAVMLKTGCKMLSLVKPQFEVGQTNIGKQGLVKGIENLVEKLEEDIRTSCDAHGFDVHDFFPCAIKGGDGNQEFWVFATKRGP